MTTEFEVGTNLQFFNGRFGIDATYYDRKTDDQIFTLPTEPATVLKRLLSEEICGFINMKKSAGMQLILSDGSTTKIIPKQWNTFLAAV